MQVFMALKMMSLAHDILILITKGCSDGSVETAAKLFACTNYMKARINVWICNPI